MAKAAVKPAPSPDEDENAAAGAVQASLVDQQLSEADERTEEDRFLAAIGEAGQGSTVYVALMMPGNKEARIWKGAPSDFDMERLALDYGSGDYRVRLYVPREGGGFALKVNKIVTQILTPAQERDLKRRRDGDDAGGAVTPQMVAQMVAEGIRAAMPQQSSMGQLKEVVEVLKPLIAPGAAAPVAVAAPASPLAGMKEMLEFATMINDLRTPSQKGVSANGFDLILKAMDRFAPALTQIAAGAASRVALPAPTADAAPTSDPAAPGSEQPTQEQMDVMNRLAQGLNYLATQAMMNADPARTAETVLNFVDEKELAAMLAQPDWFAKFSQIAPNVAPHRAWFDKLKAAIDAELAED